MNFTLTIIGTLASIVGAWISWNQASKAKDAANEVKRIRIQMIDQRKTSELSRIQASCKKALDSITKYGPASTLISLSGNSTVKDSSDVQEFMTILKEHTTHFSDKTVNDFFNVLTPILESFANSSAAEDQQKYGKQLWTHLSTMSSTIKKRLDSKIETIH
jgi:hypothetical protein